MGIIKKRVNEFPTPYTCANAVKNGGLETKLSMVLMGLGNMVHGQIAKGLIYMAVEVAYVVFMAVNGVGFLSMLPSLGSVPQKEIWDETQQIYVYTQGDQSILILLYGVGRCSLLSLWYVRGAGRLKAHIRQSALQRKGNISTISLRT